MSIPPFPTVSLQRSTVELRAKAELTERGHQLEFVGQEELDGTLYFVLKFTYADGAPIWRYINANHWLIERSREKKALHPDMDPTQTIIETRSSDFREVAGILRPFHDIQIDTQTGETLQTTQVQEMIVNPSLAPDYFNAP